MRRAGLLVLALLSLAVAGCDKCGNRIKIDTPAIQHACGDNVQN